MGISPYIQPPICLWRPNQECKAPTQPPGLQGLADLSTTVRWYFPKSYKPYKSLCNFLCRLLIVLYYTVYSHASRAQWCFELHAYSAQIWLILSYCSTALLYYIIKIFTKRPKTEADANDPMFNQRQRAQHVKLLVKQTHGSRKLWVLIKAHLSSVLKFCLLLMWKIKTTMKLYVSTSGYGSVR